MFLSVIIPHYNLEKELLERCLNSLHQQKMALKDFEVIVVDDGSDIPPDWLSENSPIQSLKLIKQPHRGLGAARNTGLDVAKGQYILFVDGDDYIFPDSLPPCLQLLRSQLPDLLGFRSKRCYTREIEHPVQEPFEQSYTYSGGNYMLHRRLRGSAWLYLFSHKLAQCHRIRFNEDILHEDEDFTTRIYYFAQQAIHCNVLVYAYYCRSTSIVQCKEKQHLNRRFEDVIKVLSFLTAFEKEQCSTGNVIQLKGLHRKITMLSVDLMLSMLQQNMPARYIKKKMKELRELKLYPYPAASYGFKYRIFRFFANRPIFIYFMYTPAHILKKKKR